MGGRGSSSSAAGRKRAAKPMTEQECMDLKGVGFAMGGYTVDKMKLSRSMTQR